MMFFLFHFINILNFDRMRRIVLIGNVGTTASLRDVNKKMVANFSLCVNEFTHDPQGNKIDKPVWFECSLWFDLPTKTDYLKHFKQGNLIYIEGVPGVHTYIKNAESVGYICVNINFYKVLIYKDGKENT
jgi:hypothetical protein